VYLLLIYFVACFLTGRNILRHIDVLPSYRFDDHIPTPPEGQVCGFSCHPAIVDQTRTQRSSTQNNDDSAVADGYSPPSDVPLITANNSTAGGIAWIRARMILLYETAAAAP
jgi:hypothetical protein